MASTRSPCLVILKPQITNSKHSNICMCMSSMKTGLELRNVGGRVVTRDETMCLFVLGVILTIDMKYHNLTVVRYVEQTLTFFV